MFTRMKNWLMSATSVFPRGFLEWTISGNIHHSRMLGSQLHCREWLPGGRSVIHLVHARTIADVRLVRTDDHLNYTNLIPTCLNCMIISLNHCQLCYILYLILLFKMCFNSY
jgi:hypothetical protein